MPNKTVQEVIERLTSIEQAFEQHLIESGAIKTDIKWLKWLCMLIVGGLFALFFK